MADYLSMGCNTEFKALGENVLLVLVFLVEPFSALDSNIDTLVIIP